MWTRRDFGRQAAGEGSMTGAHAPGSSEYTRSSDNDPKASRMQQQPRRAASRWSLLHILITILHLIPGVQTLSFVNAAVLGALGAAAALAAGTGGLTVLLVLLARWYLPAQQTHINLPMHFDYAAGPATAGAWLPLLHPSPLTAALSPPPHRVSAAAAGFAPIQIQGSLGPGSTISLSSSSSSNNKGTAVATAQPAGFWGQDGGFLGLGFSPASRAAVKQGNRSGWLRRKGRGSSSSSSSVSSSGGLPGGVDVGSGVFVPEKEWLVPQWGKMGLSVELELPGWPETDLVQITSEIISQQGILLGRSTRTWVPKPRPLLFRMLHFALFGPWRAIGLIDDTVRVQLPMFESFQNPQPPPGGWGSVKDLLNPNASKVPQQWVIHESRVPEQQQQQQEQQQRHADDKKKQGAFKASSKSSSPASAAGLSTDDSSDSEKVVGPRAMWLRVSMIGRSTERGAPRVYKAAAVLDMKLGVLDRIAAALRPSIPTCILLLVGSTSLAVVSGGTAAALLLAAYLMYSCGSSIAAAGHSAHESHASEMPGLHAENVSDRARGASLAAAVAGDNDCLDHLDDESQSEISSVGSSSEGTTGESRLALEQKQQQQRRHKVGREYGTASNAGIFDKKAPAGDLAPGSVGESTSASSSDMYEEPTDEHEIRVLTAMESQSGGRKQQQQRVGDVNTTAAAPAVAALGAELDLQPMNVKPDAQQLKQQQHQREDAQGAIGAVSAIAQMQQQQREPYYSVSGSSDTDEELMNDAGVSGLAGDAVDDWQEPQTVELDGTTGAAVSSSGQDESTTAAATAAGLQSGEVYIQQQYVVGADDDSTATTTTTAAGLPGLMRRAGYQYTT